MLAQRDAAARVSATLIELHPDIARQAAESATAARLEHVEVRAVDDAVRSWFAETGFAELDCATNDAGDRAAAGVMRFDGAPRELAPGCRLFVFSR